MTEVPQKRFFPEGKRRSWALAHQGGKRAVWLVLAVAGAHPIRYVRNAREFSDAARLLARTEREHERRGRSSTV